ncbi:NAD(P)H-dependent oxidoreductase [Panacibacter sp. DH6]|uniref:FMN dependent NADH:quinone oxidoreductase n=1 Tax=Panacibacter microcysteis TaxID=2793269 RepID=A0A931E5N2_9BACT|nr:NAD(P)H-dependent oxidoreductase [Panacibacter microcysteis]MBG9377508.1 NAD(P)H-dependent oxidoreductase [Panacibacter microcysteis]
MAKILNIQSSINGAQSVSNQLSAEIIAQITASHPGSELIIRDLGKEPVPHLDAADFTAMRIPEEQRNQVQATAVAYADMLIAEVLDADIIVIGVPFYNFHIPSVLKSWLDHLAVPGKTFNYSAAGVPEGLISGKKVYLAIAQGGVYREEPMKTIDNIEPFLRGFLGFIGMHDVTVFRADGVSIPALRDQHLASTLGMIAQHAY